ncbi:MAG TPA: hypothetical protein DCP31_26885 [Cyanobacteria bacterium UBA8543]|nr:hypothetical protein [Cyanobacteria bacterium UBA8543]
MQEFLTVKTHTYFKLSYQHQASYLSSNEKYEAFRGEQFPYAFIDYEEYPGQYNGHYKVHFESALNKDYSSPNSEQTWFVYPLDIKLSDDSISDNSSSCAQLIVFQSLNVRKALGSIQHNFPVKAYGKIVSMMGAKLTLGKRIWSQVQYLVQGWICAQRRI